MADEELLLEDELLEDELLDEELLEELDEDELLEELELLDDEPPGVVLAFFPPPLPQAAKLAQMAKAIKEFVDLDNIHTSCKK